MNIEYNEKDLLKTGNEYFDNDQLAVDVWIKKYALKNNDKWLEKTPVETLNRIINEILRAENLYPNPLSKEEIEECLQNFKYFIPGGSILYGLGNNYQLSSLGNCFFIYNGIDSYGGIFNTDESMVQLMKRRGGVGITIEDLRPSQAKVNNAAQTSTGAVSFAHRFSYSTSEVAQDGRRGALMISMAVSHPDIIKFITLKDDITKVTSANISVKITDEFMRAIEEDKDFILKWPISDKQQTIDEQIQYYKLYKRDDGSYIMRVRAREIWDLIIKQAHKTAEPGVLFWDNIIKESPADCYASDGFKTLGTNPCITGDTLIAVADGRNVVSIKQLAKEGKDVPVYCLDDKGKLAIRIMRNPRITGYNQPIYKVTLENGHEIKVTGNHKFRLTNGEYKEAKNLQYGDSLHILTKYTVSPEEIFKESNFRNIDYWWLKNGNESDKPEYEFICEQLNNNKIEKKQIIYHKNNIFENLKYEYNDKDIRILRKYQEALLNGYNVKITDDNQLLVEKTCEKCGNKFWTNYNTREYAFCSIDCSNKYINKKSYKIKEEKKTQQLKIFSDLKFKLKREPSYYEWVTKCKENNISYKLNTKHGFKSFNEIKENAEFYNHKVISVELCGYEDVYNGTVDNYHNFFCGGFKEKTKSDKTKLLFINNLQCGEVPLSPYDSCRLGSINLNNMVIDPYTSNARFDFKLLARVTRIAQRIMDDIVTLEEEKIKNIIAKIENDPEDIEFKRTELNLWNKILNTLLKGRRTGIGVLGLGDAFAKLGLKYGTKEATNFANEIFKTIAVNSYKESVKLAKERGAFPIWNADKEANNPFIIRVISNNFSNKEYNDYLTYGRRNIATMSIAPTGSLALLARTTSGIEPVFKCYYKRRRKINPNEENVRIDYKDENGNCWQEYNVYHPEFEKWYKKNYDKDLSLLSDNELNDIIKVSPWANSQSHEINYIEKVHMQGVIQKWIDHSISITHNLPQNISLEEVNKIYFTAWKEGCKGCTIYREGSRQGVLISNKEKEDEIKVNNAPKRPKELKADYYVTSANGIKFAVIVGLWKDNTPYEIFAFENPPMDKNTTGKIIKVKKGHYKFVNSDFEIDNIQLAAERIEQRAHTIFLSMLLRHGVPIEYIVKVAKKVDDNITSFSSACRRILSRYLISKNINEKCPNCGGNLIREEGCIHCDSCEYSKCG